MIRSVRFLALALFLTALPAKAQFHQGIVPPSLRVFLDCERGCDRTFIRSEVGVVDFVNDRTASDVHLLITRERTGSGGEVYSLAFLGQRVFSALSDTLTYVSISTETEDEQREGLVRTIKNGLVRYLARTALASTVDVRLERKRGSEARVAESSQDDPWNYWVFQIGGNGDFSAEESSNNLQIRTNLSANRTTEDWKVRLSANGRRQERHFDLEDGRITSITQDGSLWFMAVKSLGGHWSAGGTVYFSTSTRNNTDASVTTGPAIEYNFFPYNESTRREFRIQYGIRWDRVRYDEVTIFNLEEETILKHALEAHLDIKQPWGDLGFDAELSHLLTNFDRSLTKSYRLELDFGTDVRVARGLSISVDAGYELIRDQLFLPLSDISEEEILLGTRRLPTGFDLNFGFGINYRFGSIYNNVVNPRFGF